MILCDQTCPNPARVRDSQQTNLLIREKAESRSAKSKSQRAAEARANLPKAYASLQAGAAAFCGALLKFQFENGTGINLDPAAAQFHQPYWDLILFAGKRKIN